MTRILRNTAVIALLLSLLWSAWAHSACKEGDTDYYVFPNVFRANKTFKMSKYTPLLAFQALWSGSYIGGAYLVGGVPAASVMTGYVLATELPSARVATGIYAEFLTSREISRQLRLQELSRIEGVQSIRAL